jgi:hypothetical protein
MWDVESTTRRKTTMVARALMVAILASLLPLPLTPDVFGFVA